MVTPTPPVPGEGLLTYHGRLLPAWLGRYAERVIGAACGLWEDAQAVDEVGDGEAS